MPGSQNLPLVKIGIGNEFLNRRVAHCAFIGKK